VIRKQRLSEGQTSTNSAFCLEVIGRLLKRISGISLQFRAEREEEKALVVKTCVTSHSVVEVSSRYSPDFAPADIFLFSAVRTALKENNLTERCCCFQKL
jgi:hypothetical protein